ncbi:Fic/DOC family protein [Rhodococcus sp. ACT016]|uniref:Fic/DOC family protein n=1 Tax=Rhodococcus sp. ACT016 TaxID=3134808 RepID=UPI003D26BC67
MRNPFRRAERPWTWEDYFIPGTIDPRTGNGVLKNNFTGTGHPHGTPNEVLLEDLEAQFTHLRMIQLMRIPIDCNFDYDHMKAIHHHIFQDVYPWAGKERTAPEVPMRKAGRDLAALERGEVNPRPIFHEYPAAPDISARAQQCYTDLARDNHLRGRGRDAFVRDLAHIWCRINEVHSFREGNTRSQFAYFHQLSQQAGYDLDVARFADGEELRNDFVNGRFYYQQTGRSDWLADALQDAVIPLYPEPEPERSQVVSIIDNGVVTADLLDAFYAVADSHPRDLKTMLGSAGSTEQPPDSTQTHQPATETVNELGD